LALSLSITIFSFAGIPPLIGFFAKQIVLSAALDNGYIFIVLVAILSSVISAVYYLNIIKEIFFDKSEYKFNTELDNINIHGNIIKNNKLIEKFVFKGGSVIISSYLSITISILTLIILLFIFIPNECLNMANILSIMLFNS